MPPNPRSPYAPGMKPGMFEHYPPQAGTVIEAEQVCLDPLRGQVVAILGYGTMGRAQAQNLRRSGIQTIVGSRAGSDSPTQTPLKPCS